MGLDQGIILKKKGRGRKKKTPDDVVFFRKCNQLHGWMIRNCVSKYYEDISNWDGSPIEITTDDINNLLSDVKKVIKKSKLRPGIIRNGFRVKEVYGSPVKVYNHEFGKKILFKRTAKKLLPTYEGPFFGSYDYDEFYYEQLIEIEEELDNLLHREDLANFKLYYWAWW